MGAAAAFDINRISPVPAGALEKTAQLGYFLFGKHGTPPSCSSCVTHFGGTIWKHPHYTFFHERSPWARFAVMKEKSEHRKNAMLRCHPISFFPYDAASDLW